MNSLKDNNKLPADSAFISLSDFERIRKNAKILTKEEENNQKKIIQEQKEQKYVNSKVNAYLFFSRTLKSE